LTSSTGNDGTGDPTVQAMSRAEILSVVAFCLAATLFYGIVVWFGPVGRGEYQFPDAYMHLVRAAELWEGGGWYDHEIARGNAPYGEILHWTRPFDVILLAAAALFRPFLEARDALFWAGALLAPFLTVVTCLAAAWAIGPLVGAARLWVLPILFLQWPVMGYGYPGRADHHIVILLLLVLVLGVLFRTRSRPDQARWPLLAGLCHGLGLWVAAEFVIVLAISLGFLSLSWVLERDRAAVFRLGRDNLLFALGLLAVTLVGVAAEHPPDDLWLVEYDRISIVHGALAGLAGVVWLVLGRLGGTGAEVPSVGRRLIWLVLVGAAAAGLLVAAFPGLMENPMDPQLAFEGLRSLISEVMPLYPNTPRRLNTFLISLALVFVAAPALVWILATRPLGTARASWWLVAGAGLVYLGLSLWQQRFSAYLSPFLVIPAVYLVGCSYGALARPLGRGLARAAQALLCLALVALPFVLQQAHVRLALEGRAEAVRSKPGCRITEIADFLNGEGTTVTGQRTIMTPLGYTTAVLYFTRHAVVGSAYHRNVAGTRDTYALMEAVDDAAAFEAVEARAIELFLLCAMVPDGSFRDQVDGRPTLHRRLLDDRPPPWLKPVDLPDDLGTRFTVYTTSP
jgi:asparagine N-glycosylation enzyme membrane subunit Stt3